MPLDPQFRAALDALESSGALPIVRDSAEDTRERFRALVLGRRGPDHVPRPVAEVVDRVIEGTATAPLPVRIYTPLRARDRVLVYAHGGGWVLGDLDTHDPAARRLADALGATVVAVDYRLAPEYPYPAALEDVLAAVAWAGAQHPGWTLAVAGESAGASLAAAAALGARDAGGPRLAAQLLLYPAVDPTLSSPSMRANGSGYFLTHSDMSWFLDQYLPEPASRARPDVDLLHGPDLAGVAPAVVATAEYDPLRDEGDAYAERLRAAGVTVRHLPGPGLIHGYFGYVDTVAAADRRGAEVVAALDELLG